MDKSFEHIELLQNKIRVLETLLECRNSEIEILKNCLKEIGTQIKVEDVVEPDFHNLLNNPFAKVEMRKTILSLERVYVYSKRDHVLLDKINDALRRVQ